MKKTVVIITLVIFSIIFIAGVVGVSSKKVDCSGIADSKQKNRCHLYNLLSSYGFAKDYNQFINSKPYERPKPKYFTMQFRDEAIDNDHDGKFDVLRIYMGINASEAGNYEFESWIYDDKNAPFEHTEKTIPLESGLNEIFIEIPSQRIYEHKISGPLNINYLSLSKEGKQLESASPKSETNGYDFSQFSAILPDLIIKSVEKKGNDVIVIVINIGKKPAFSVFVDFLVNDSLYFGKTNQNSVVLMKPGDEKQFTMTAPNTDNYSIIVDPWNKVDESNETNNEMLIVE